MVKILWLSRHKPLPLQEAWLIERFGVHTRIEQDPNPFSGADDIVQRFEEGEYDEMVVVAPLSVIAQLVQRGIKPLWAEMQLLHTKPEGEEPCEEYNGDSDTILFGSDYTSGQKIARHFRFVTFKRISRVVMEFEEV